MTGVVDFKRFSLIEATVGSFYNDELSNKFWDKYKDKTGDTRWVFDGLVRKKLLKISEDFYSKFGDLLGDIPIVDIQLTGSLANYNYTDKSDLDIHVLVDFNKVNSPKEVLKAAIDGIRFIWNLRHDVIIRDHDVELYLQDVSEPHTSTGLYSLKNNKWIKKPQFNPPKIDEQDVNKKYESLVSEIHELESKLVTSVKLPSDAKDMYKRLVRLKEKIQKMRKESLAKEGEFAVGNLTFKLLRNNGYIGKIIDLLTQAYTRIYSE